MVVLPDIRQSLWIKDYLKSMQGTNYFDTFSPMVRHTTVRILLALAAINHWKLRQLNIKNAFLHGEQEEIYMKQK